MKKNLLFPALGIGRATVLCNNVELVNPCKARPRRNAHARPKEHALLNLLWFLLFPSGRRQGGLILRDGQILILRGDKTYTLQGQETIVP